MPEVSALVKQINTDWHVDRWQRLLNALRYETADDREMAGVEQVLRLFGLTKPLVGSPH